jgi:hypothetical protein
VYLLLFLVLPACGDDDDNARRGGGAGDGDRSQLPAPICGEDYLIAFPEGPCGTRSGCPTLPEPPFRRLFEVGMCDPSEQGADCAPGPLDPCLSGGGRVLLLAPRPCSQDGPCQDSGVEVCQGFVELDILTVGDFVVEWKAYEHDACGGSSLVSEGEVDVPSPCCGTEFEVEVSSDGSTRRMFVGAGWEKAD